MDDSRPHRTDQQPVNRDAVTFRWLFAHLGVSGKPVAPTAIVLCGMVLAAVIIIVWILSR